MEGRLSAQERLLAIVQKLAAHPIDGLSNKALAYELKTIDANVCRDLKLLESYGWVAHCSDHRWRLSEKFGGFAGQIMKGFQAAKLRLAEDEARYASAMQ
jgi:DNA-binding IclR family transcriptional regulator